MRKTKIFPYDFVSGSNKERFIVRLLPNLNRFKKLGNPIESALIDIPEKKIPGNILYSYAIISKDYEFHNKPISIIRYGVDLRRLIDDMLYKRISIFDLTNPYAILVEVSYEDPYKKYNYQIIEDNQFIIFNGNGAEKDNIVSNMLDRDISLERISLNTSSEKYKSEIFDKHKDIFRAEAIEDIGI